MAETDAAGASDDRPVRPDQRNDPKGPRDAPASVSEESVLSIGEVLTVLTDEFPDVTISKIRFLESQGLVQPDRNASGYRQFAATDIERLRWILRQQRDHFLPLKVIRRALERGVDVIDAGAEDQPTLWSAVAEAAAREEVGNERERVARSEVAEARRNAARSRSHPSKRAAGGSRGAGVEAPDAADQAQRRRFSSPADVVAALQEPPGATHADTGGAATGAAGSGSGDEAAKSGSRSTGTEGGAAPADESEGEPESSDHDEADPVGSASDPTDEVPATGASGDASDGRGPNTERPAPGGQMRQVNREELLEESGLSGDLLDELVEFGLLAAEVVAGEETYDEVDVSIALAAARCAELGLTPRHLRMYKVAAIREAGLLEQVAMPLLKQRNPAAKSKAAETVAEVSKLGTEIHALLLARELGPHLAP